MSRLTSSANQAAVAAPHVPYILFADLDFVSGHVLLTSWDQNFTWGGNTYLSIGKFANLSDYPETADLTSASLTFTLSGTDPALMSTVLTEKYHNRNAKLYVGWLNAANALVDTPYLLWEGFMDSMQIHSDAGIASISLICETRLLLLGKVAGWMYTDVHQKQFKSGDGFFNLVASLANKTVSWGTAPAASTTSTKPPVLPNSRPAPAPAKYPGRPSF